MLDSTKHFLVFVSKAALISLVDDILYSVFHGMGEAGGHYCSFAEYRVLQPLMAAAGLAFSGMSVLAYWDCRKKIA